MAAPDSVLTHLTRAATALSAGFREAWQDGDRETAQRISAAHKLVSGEIERRMMPVELAARPEAAHVAGSL